MTNLVRKGAEVEAEVVELPSLIVTVRQNLTKKSLTPNLTPVMKGVRRRKRKSQPKVEGEAEADQRKILLKKVSRFTTT